MPISPSSNARSSNRTAAKDRCLVLGAEVHASGCKEIANLYERGMSYNKESKGMVER